MFWGTNISSIRKPIEKWHPYTFITTSSRRPFKTFTDLLASCKITSVDFNSSMWNYLYTIVERRWMLALRSNKVFWKVMPLKSKSMSGAPKYFYFLGSLFNHITLTFSNNLIFLISLCDELDVFFCSLYCVQSSLRNSAYTWTWQITSKSKIFICTCWKNSNNSSSKVGFFLNLGIKVSRKRNGGDIH